MEILFHKLKELNSASGNKLDLSDDFLNRLPFVYPFNKFEYIISQLIAEKILTIEQHLEIKDSYFKRNPYLHLYEMAPATFGSWLQKHLTKITPELKPPSKELDVEYSKQYDLWYDGIKIEVKSSRVVKRKSGGSLVEKALLSTSKSGFVMNFQQIKSACTDVFVFIAIWRDTIKYWVFSSDEVKGNKHFSKGQHRGNVGEGQLWITDKNISEFDEFLVKPRDILKAIKKKGKVSAQKEKGG